MLSVTYSTALSRCVTFVVTKSLKVPALKNVFRSHPEKATRLEAAAFRLEGLMKKNKVIIWFIALLISAHVLVAGAQDKSKQEKGEIRLSTELVQIDVLVTDKRNKPVAGLTREDFELYDNNKPQHVTNFAYEET